MQLKPHQYAGVEFLTTLDPRLNNKPHKLLAWDRGTGKTVVTCVALKQERVESTLIICPKSVKKHWKHHLIQSQVAKEHQIQIIESGSDRLYSASKPFVIVNYELAITKNVFIGLTHLDFDATIIDEAHRCSALTSKTSSRILGGHKLGSKNLIETGYHRWLLTGTPAKNGRPIELFPALKVLAPECLQGKLQDGSEFDYSDYAKYGHRFCGGEAVAFRGAENLDELAVLLEPFMSVCTFEQACPEVPPVVYEDVYLDIGTMYEDSTNTLMPTLRKLQAKQKLDYSIEYLQDRIDTDRIPLLIFTYQRETTIELASRLNGYCIHGGVSANQRDRIIEAFGSDSRPLVAQIDCLSEAFDGLQYKTHQIVHAEGNWIPDTQAVGRLQRMGQTKTVLVTRLIAEDTLDRPMVGTVINKTKNIKRITNMPPKKSTPAVINLSAFEQFLSDVTRIADSLETLAGNGSPSQGEPTPPANVATVQDQPVPATTTAAPATNADALLNQIKKTAADFLGSFGPTDAEQDPGYQMISDLWKSKFGVESIKSIPADRYPDALAAIQGLKKPEQATTAKRDI